MKDKWRPIIEVTINLAASILLVKSLGLKGIFIGTLISTVTVPLWREYYLLNKYVFKSKKIMSVCILQLLFVALAAALGVGIYYIFIQMPSSFWWLVLKIVLCAVSIPLILLLLTFKMDERKYLTGFILKVFKRIFIKNKKDNNEVKNE